MARGPKPAPEGVKAQKSAVRSTRSNAAVDEAVASEATKAPAKSAIEPPAWLKDEGLKIWRRISPRLVQAKLLSSADTETFGRYCRNFARWLKLQAQLDSEGETYEAETYLSNGLLAEPEAANVRRTLKRVHPAFTIADRLERQLLAIEDRFGINPAERQRIFAQRAATGSTGDLFDPVPERGRGDPAAQPVPPAQPAKSAIGLLQ